MDALADALGDLERRGIRPKYIYTIPTVQNPTGAHPGRGAPRRAPGAVAALRRADLRGRVLLRPGVDGRAAARRSTPWPSGAGRDPRRLVLQVGGAGAARRLHRRALGDPLPHPAAQDRRRLRRAGADGAGRVLPRPLRGACAEAAGRPARQARDPDGGAGRAVRHCRRVRRSARRHLPVGQAARQRRHAGAGAGGAGRGHRHQPGPRVGDRQGLRQEPPAAVLRQSLARRRSARASPRSPACATASSACRCGWPTWRAAEPAPHACRKLGAPQPARMAMPASAPATPAARRSTVVASVPSLSRASPSPMPTACRMAVAATNPAA